MTQDTLSPIRPTDDTARTLARDLIAQACIAALGVVDPDTGAPYVTRIAFGCGPDGELLTLISDLSAHAARLKASPICSLLIGEAPTKGDPLAFPRLSLSAKAQVVPKDDALRTAWLSHHPKSKLYIDFADFNFVRFTPLSADLNGGFGKAYTLSADDLIA
ncbi:HugZ family protein [Celeribacter sp.]|uniref:HugZ family pyridoxamine 5'-phosphate oxidase n=1 Tax=Celeribacter sp. TaxID=1890673 RepID=UPI003A8EFB13